MNSSNTRVTTWSSLMLVNSEGIVSIKTGGFKSFGPPLGDMTEAQDVSTKKTKPKNNL